MDFIFATSALLLGIVNVNLGCTYFQLDMPGRYILYYFGFYIIVVPFYRIITPFRHSAIISFLMFLYIFSLPAVHKEGISCFASIWEGKRDGWAIWNDLQQCYWVNAIFVNLSTFFITQIDTQLARDGYNGVPEVGLHELVLYGGWCGSVLGRIIGVSDVGAIFQPLIDWRFLLENACNGLLHYLIAVMLFMATNGTREARLGVILGPLMIGAILTGLHVLYFFPSFLGSLFRKYERDRLYARHILRNRLLVERKMW